MSARSRVWNWTRSNCQLSKPELNPSSPTGTIKHIKTKATKNILKLTQRPLVFPRFSHASVDEEQLSNAGREQRISTFPFLFHSSSIWHAKPRSLLLTTSVLVAMVLDHFTMDRMAAKKEKNVASNAAMKVGISNSQSHALRNARPNTIRAMWPFHPKRQERKRPKEAK